MGDKSDENDNINDQPRKGSVKDLILRAERNSKKIPSNQPNQTLSRRPPPIVPKKIPKKVDARKMVDPEIRKYMIDGDKYPEGTLQNKLSHSINVHNKRVRAKVDYLKRQKALQKEYEAKVRELHRDFSRAESSLMHTFPPEKTPEQKKKLKVIEKLKKDIKEEKDEKQKKKLEKEVELVTAEMDKLKPPSELELDDLNSMWLSVNASQWDLLLSNNYYRYNNNSGYNPRPYDVFESMRRQDDQEVSKNIGTTGKNGKKINLGNATFWTLGQIACDEQSLKAFQEKENTRYTNIAKQAIKIAGVEDSKTNRDKAVGVLKKNGWKSLRQAVECFGKVSDVNKLNKISEEESKMNRVVVVRVIQVDRVSERIRVVMILDRNGRPCAGGLPRADTKSKANYQGADKLILPTETVPEVQDPAATVTTETGESDLTYGSGSNSGSGSGSGSGSSDSGTASSATTDIEDAAAVEEIINEATEVEAENNETEEEAVDEEIEGYCTTEGNLNGREFSISLSDMLSVEGVSIIEEDMRNFFKARYNDYIPHITYQRIAGFQVFNNNLNTENSNNNNNRRRRDRYDDAGDFQIVDLGIKLNFDPLVPFEEYEPDWRNGKMYSLRHKKDGPIRFVAFNETGFGFMEDRPIGMHVQKLFNSNNEVIGVNIVHMTLYDTNEQICFDTLYLKDDEDMEKDNKWRTFGKDAIGNRLAYRIVAQKGNIEAVLYPFQGRVKHAKLNIVDVTHLKEGEWVNVLTEGQTGRRLARVKSVPTGMVLGKCELEKKTTCTATPFLEMLRIGQRIFTEMAGLVDLEIFCEDNQLLKEVREESWPIETCFAASKEDMTFLKSLEAEKEELEVAHQKEISSLIADAKSYVGDRSNRKDPEKFTQECESLKLLLDEKKGVFEENESDPLLKELNEVVALLNKNITGAKRALAFRKSKERKDV